MMDKYFVHILVIVIFAGWLYLLCTIFGQMGFMVLGLAFTFTFATLVIIVAVREIIWRISNGVNLFETLETNPEVLKLKLLLKMRQCDAITFPDAFKKIMDDAHNYPNWDIIGSKMFQSWYKYYVDYMLQYPMHYDLSCINDGRPYIKDKDPHYNYDTLPWEETNWVEIPFIE